MVNVNKLRGKIVECDMNVEKIAEMIGMDKEERRSNGITT